MSKETNDLSEIRQRKKSHLAICTQPSRYPIEGRGAGFEAVHFIHDALPEVSESEIDTSTEFLGARLPVPFFISCMTGGAEEGALMNRKLAEAAQELGIPVGLGSIRALMENPEVFEDFHIKPLAPGVPVLANISAVQVRDGNERQLFDALERLEVQALVVHVNPAQELFQPEGDRDFRGLKEAIAGLCSRSPLPVIVKEVGFGIRPSLARELLAAGAAYIDLAGAGGTDWIMVEAWRLSEEERSRADDFRDWGIPTAMLLAAFRGRQARLLASGGLRTGVDAAKAMALGAELCGFALPVIREAAAGGTGAVVRFFRRLESALRTVMVLTGSRSIADLRAGKVWLDPVLKAAIDSFTQGESRGA